jgi:septal ring factor EnvC (AmiA/AmiB activator)
MSDGLAKRGVFPTVENTAAAGATLNERLQSVLRRVQDRPGDAPIVVSAGFLRWIADASAASASKHDVAELQSQIDRLTRERDEVLETVAQVKAHSDRVTEQLHLADVRVATLSKRVATLREALTTAVGKSAAGNK